MGNDAPTLKRTAITGALVVLAGIGLAFGLYSSDASSAPSWTKPAESATPLTQRAAGGEVRIAVSTPPELQDTGAGGSAVRSLVLPHLFVAQPNGSWQASLVQPGSDGARSDGLTAWFVLRSAAKWSNGTPITVDDLRRTMDGRFVSSVDSPNASGRITVHLKSKLPGWRRLWSDDAGIAAPIAGVYGGPFVVQSVVSGDETVLTRNASWYAPAFLDDVKLEYVPDAATARQLLGAGTVDVVAPVADTVRTNHFQALAGVTVSATNQGGTWTALRFNTGAFDQTHVDVLRAFPRTQFVNSLLAGEASVVSGFAEDDATWTNYGVGAGSRVGLGAANITLTVPAEDPLSPLLSVSLQQVVTSGGGKLQVRSTDSATVAGLIAAKTFDLALVTNPATSQFCWTCAFGDVDAILARQADAGDKKAALALEVKARNNGVLLPLWREHTVVAYKTAAVSGVAANGYATSPVAGAGSWWKP